MWQITKFSCAPCKVFEKNWEPTYRCQHAQIEINLTSDVLPRPITNLKKHNLWQRKKKKCVRQMIPHFLVKVWNIFHGGFSWRKASRLKWTNWSEQQAKVLRSWKSLAVLLLDYFVRYVVATQISYTDVVQWSLTFSRMP